MQFLSQPNKYNSEGKCTSATDISMQSIKHFYKELRITTPKSARKLQKKQDNVRLTKHFGPFA
jgi:hypothetical protein